MYPVSCEWAWTVYSTMNVNKKHFCSREKTENYEKKLQLLTYSKCSRFKRSLHPTFPFNITKLRVVEGNPGVLVSLICSYCEQVIFRTRNVTDKTTLTATFCPEAHLVIKIVSGYIHRGAITAIVAANISSVSRKTIELDCATYWNVGVQVDNKVTGGGVLASNSKGSC